MKPERSSRFGVVVISSCALILPVAARPALGQGFKVIHVCSDVEKFPNGLVQAPMPDGNFYGTSLGGGIGNGRVFKMTPGGTVTGIYDFGGPPADGKFPWVGLFLDGSMLYGTTHSGGTNDVGSVFHLDTSGGNYAVHSQPAPMGVCSGNTGATPEASFMKASDGNYYVPMAICGGANQVGNVDEVDSALTETGVAIGFDYLTGDMNHPNGRLVEGADNKLYGTGNESGATTQLFGGVYRLGLGGGAVETVHTFSGTDGIYPQAPLVLATDGNFYGTTFQLTDASHNLIDTGTIFKVAEDGTFQTVHVFTGTDGRNPTAGLVQASDGDLYGGTNSGGPSGTGVIYRLDLAGNYKVLATVADALIGSSVNAELIQGLDGKLYGTTTYGNLYGTIFTIDLTQKVDAIVPNSGPATGGTAVTLNGAGFVAGATVTLGDLNAQNVAVPDAAHITASTALSSQPGTVGNVKVALPDTTVILLNKGWLYDFLDVPTGDIFHDYVRKVLAAGITAGCGGGNYCRNNPVQRNQMAVFLLKAEHGSAYAPPFCSGVFPDVPCPGTFTDWIEQLYHENITGGCGSGNYCPNDPVTRQQMAVFLLKTEHGSGYTPPACASVFGDVACPSLFAAWIEQLYAENVTGGCQASPLLYCPGNSVLRGQMAVFLTKTFSLQ